MPTLLNQNGYKFFFYANEHPPPHVHVIYAERWAKIDLNNNEVIVNTLKRSELKECMAIYFSHRTFFLEIWNEWFGR